MTIREVRAVCILLAVAMAAAWLCIVFLSATRGDDLLLYALAISIGMFFLGVVCVALTLERVVRPSFAAAVIAAPLLHGAGAFMEGFWCLLPFVAPSATLVFLGIRELSAELPSQ